MIGWQRISNTRHLDPALNVLRMPAQVARSLCLGHK